MKRFHSLLRNFGLTALVLMAAMLPLLSGCQDSPGSKAEETAGVGPSGVTFAVYDQNFAPVAGASVYLDSGTAPVAVTDAAGQITLSLTGIHDVHIYKSGYGARSYIHRDWSTVATQQTVRLPINLGTAATGTIIATISGTATSDPMYRARAVRLDDGFSLTGPDTPGVIGSTPYTWPVFQGNNEFFLYPAAASTPSSTAYAAYYAPTLVTGAGAAISFTPTVGGGTTFSMAGNNGIPGGTISSSYVISRDPYSISPLFSNGTPGTASMTLTGDMLTVPPVHSVYPGANYQVIVNSQINGVQPRPQRSWMEIYRNHSELLAAPLSPSYTLPNFGVSVGLPADNTVSVGLTPTINWTMAGSPQFTEIVLLRYIAAFPGYVETVWQAWVFGQNSAPFPAVIPPLLPNTFYAYNLQGRTNHLDGAGVYRGFERDGYQNIRFSTNATTPP